MFEEPLDHQVPANLLELYEVLEYTGKIVPHVPKMGTRVRSALRPLVGALTSTPLPPNYVSRAAAQLRPPTSRQSLTGTRGNTLHWEGPTMGVFSHDSCAPKVRGIQAFHMDSRGWADIAYSSMVCPHGYVFEGRWYGIRTAAQGTNIGNDQSFAHCYLSGSGDPFDMPAKKGLRAVFEHFEARGSGTTRWGHREWHSTACPGDAEFAWLKAGMPVDAPAPPTPPPGDGRVQVDVRMPELRRGSKGQHVEKLQSLLNVMDKSSKPRLKVDGDFGGTTETFVRDWQQFFHLQDVAGVCSAQTWHTLIELPL